MTRCSNALAMAVFGLLVTTPLCAEPPRDDQIQADQRPNERSEHQPKHVVHGLDPAIQLRHQLRDATNKGLVGIVSEGTDETVDMAVALAAEHSGVRLLPVAGAGASQNVKDVIFARGIDFGIVPTDVLDQIRRNPPFPGVEKYLQYVTKLYDQQVHLLAGPDVQSVTDLAGKKVNFGRRGSGTYLTATNIFKALGVEPDVTVLPHPRALDQLRRGELSAMVYVGTKPSRMFQDIRPDEKLHFLSITGNVPRDYSAVSIAAEDYPELVSKRRAGQNGDPERMRRAFVKLLGLPPQAIRRSIPIEPRQRVAEGLGRNLRDRHSIAPNRDASSSHPVLLPPSLVTRIADLELAACQIECLTAHGAGRRRRVRGKPATG